jgi:hypothetical protein
VVKINSNVTIVIVINISRGLAKVIPDAGAASIFICSPFDLVSSSGNAPREALGKVAQSARCEVL